MANFFKAKPKPRQKREVSVTINALDHLGQGVTRIADKPVFVAGALPGETVRISFTSNHKTAQRAELKQVELASEMRTEPACRYFGACGGCQLMHMHPEAQTEHKAQALQQLFTRKGIAVEQWHAPIHGEANGYRRRVRLAVDARKRPVKLGFRQDKSQKIQPIQHCLVMQPILSDAIVPLHQTLNAMQQPARIGHIELFALQANANSQDVVHLLVRCTQALSAADKSLLLQLAQSQQWLLWWDRGQGAEPAAEIEQLPSYPLEPQIQIQVKPGDFFQVNAGVNRMMVTQAMDWLAPQANELALDLFAGVGNFTLPLAKRCASVVGVEGVASMTARLLENARLNGITNVEAETADLSAPVSDWLWLKQRPHVMVIDPARAGAEMIAAQIQHIAPQRLLYVSCNPATLVRDAQLLQKHGYQALKACAMDMFPHTQHMEAMVLFQRAS